MSGRVDEVEVIRAAVSSDVAQSSRLCLDGDSSLTLDVHRVEDLRLHFAVGEATTALDESVGERGLAMIDVGNDRKVTDVIHWTAGAISKVSPWDGAGVTR